MSETQATITAWGRATFGDNPVPVIVARCNIEMVELVDAAFADCWTDEMLVIIERMKADAEALNALVCKAQEAGQLDDLPKHMPAVLSECADVNTIMMQVASKAGGELQAETDVKMKVNRARRWQHLGGGRMQHVEGT